jgi:uncharacterized repeat protein (TIGR01451 family)
LEVSSAAAPDPVWAGSTLTYTLAVTNAGNVLLHATIETALPEQVTPTVPVAWAPLVLEPGDAWTEIVPVEVAPHYGGVLTNVLSVETVEKVSGAYTTTVLSLAPAVTLTQWTESTSADALAGEPLTYTLQVINEGNVDLHAIILDLVPEHVTPTQGLLWWMTTITAPGGIWEGTAAFLIEPGYSGPLTNVLQVRTFEGISETITHTLGATSAITGLQVVNDSPTLLLRTTMLTATITAGSDVTYLWDFGDGSPLLSRSPNLKRGVQVYHVYPAVGVYTATVTAENKYGSVVGSTQVSIVQPSGPPVYLPLVVRGSP